MPRPANVGNIRVRSTRCPKCGSEEWYSREAYNGWSISCLTCGSDFDSEYWTLWQVVSRIDGTDLDEVHG